MIRRAAQGLVATFLVVEAKIFLQRISDFIDILVDREMGQQLTKVMQVKTPSGNWTSVFLLLMLLVGLNLRPALTSLAPVLSRIQQDIGLSASAIGALTTLPVLCLGLFAPLAPWLSRRLGVERSLSLGLLVLALAQIVRASHSEWLLFFGTLLAGAAIGVCGTLLPGLVKRELPMDADLITGIYTMALCLGGALGAGLSIPLAQWLGGWAYSLASWSLLALAALLAWRKLMPHPWPDRRLGTVDDPKPRLWMNALAWQVTLLMGTQSSLAYIAFGWLPTLLQLRGIGEGKAGWMLAVTMVAQLFSALGAPWLGRLGRDQRPALLLLFTLTCVGLLLLLVGPLSLGWLGTVILGLGQGGSFSLMLTLIVLRSGNAILAGQLSGMVQGVGYCVAAIGPLGIGIMLEHKASLASISLILAVIALLSIIFALLAGRRLCLEVNERGQLITQDYR